MATTCPECHSDREGYHKTFCPHNAWLCSRPSSRSLTFDELSPHDQQVIREFVENLRR